MKTIIHLLLLYCCTVANAQSNTTIQHINDSIDSFGDDPYFGIAVQLKKGDDVCSCQRQRVCFDASWKLAQAVAVPHMKSL